MRVWIWGGSKGIGAALAQRFIRGGDDVLCLSRTQPDFECTWEPFDVDRPGEAIASDVAQMILAAGMGINLDDLYLRALKLPIRSRWLYERRGAPDVAILSAGIGAYLRQDLWRDDWWRDSSGKRQAGINSIIRTNLASRMWITNALVRAMRRRRSGQIILIGSRVSTRGAHALEVYAATQAALRGYVYSACRHPAKRGVTIALAEPGWTLTPMTASISAHVARAIENELGPMMSAEEVADQIVAHLPRFAAGEVLEIGR